MRHVVKAGNPDVLRYKQIAIELGCRAGKKFGKQLLSSFLVKTIAALFDFNNSGGLGREGNLNL